MLYQSDTSRTGSRFDHGGEGAFALPLSKSNDAPNSMIPGVIDIADALIGNQAKP